MDDTFAVSTEVKNEVEFLKWLLDRLNPETGIEIILCSEGPIDSQTLPWRGYTLQRNGGDSRRKLYVTLEHISRDSSLQQKAKSDLRAAILRLWGGATEELSTTVHLDF